VEVRSCICHRMAHFFLSRRRWGQGAVRNSGISLRLSVGENLRTPGFVGDASRWRWVTAERIGAPEVLAARDMNMEGNGSPSRGTDAGPPSPEGCGATSRVAPGPFCLPRQWRRRPPRFRASPPSPWFRWTSGRAWRTSPCLASSILACSCWARSPHLAKPPVARLPKPLPGRVARRQLGGGGSRCPRPPLFGGDQPALPPPDGPRLCLLDYLD